MVRNFRKYTLLIVTWAILLTGTGLSAQEQSTDAQKTLKPAPRKVLVINSYHYGYIWSDGIMKAIVNEFRINCPGADLFFEFMDTKNYTPDEVFEPFRKLYKLKYENSQPDVIISSDNNALDFLLKYRSELFPGVPIVFCGVQKLDESMLKGHDSITGVIEKEYLLLTAEIALKLHPSAKRIVLVDHRPLFFVSKFRKNIAKLRQRQIEVVSLTPPRLTPQQIVKELEQLDSDSIVIPFNTLYGPLVKNLHIMKEEALKITQNCSAPVYAMASSWLGFGVVGGNMAEPYNQGCVTAKMAIRILNGESPDKIPIIHESPNDYMFDYIQLKRFGISLSDLPEGSIIINEPKSFYYDHKEYIWIVTVVIIILTVMLFILSLNILARKKAQKQLEKTQFAVDQAADAIFWIGSDARILYVNKAACRTLGYSNSQLLSMTIHEIDPEYTAEVWPEHWEELRRRKSFTFESRHRAKDGRIFPVEICVNYLEFDGRECTYAFVRDISDRKQMEKRLRENEKLAAAGRLAARIAHEINNPLAGIKNAFTLVKGAIPQDYQYYDYVARIDNEIIRVSRIVRQMFDLYRPELELANKFRLGDIISDVVSLVEISDEEKNVNIEVDIKDESVVVMLAEGLFRQILFNVIQNAIEASEAGKTVKVSAQMADDTLTVKVTNQGPCIDPEVRERIFEPFFTTKKNFANSGLGLGLAVCKTSVEAMGGQITVESDQDTQTVFTITIPLNTNEGRRENG